MKKISRSISFFLMVCILACSVATPTYAGGLANLIQNPGFNGGLEHWSFPCESSPTNHYDTRQKILSDGSKTQSLFLNSTAELYAYQDVEIPRAGYYAFSVKGEYLSYPEYRKAFLKVEVDGKTYRMPFAPDVPVLFSTQGPTTARVYLMVSDTYAWFYDVSLAEASSMVSNGGFENGMEHWMQAGAANSFVTSAVRKEGKNSLYMGYFVNEGLENYVKQDIAVTGGGTFILSASIKADASLSGIGGMVILEARDSAGTLLRAGSSASVSDPSKSWQKVSATLEAPAQTQTITIKIAGLYCTGAFYVDNVSLYQI